MQSSYKNLEFQKIGFESVGHITDADLYIISSNSKIHLNSILPYIISQEVPTIIIGQGVNQDLIFFSEPSNNLYLQSLDSVIRSLNMNKKIGLICSSGCIQLEALDYLKSKGYLIVAAFLDIKSTESMATELVGKYFKSQGITDYIVLVEQSLCSKIENSFLNLKLNKKWNIVVYGKECTGSLYNQGSLFIALDKFENLTYNNWQGAYKYLNLLNEKFMSTEQILRKFRNKKIPFDFLLMNIQASKNFVVGEIKNGFVNMVSEIVYPSGLKNREIINKVPIRLSANTGVSNPLGHPNAYQNAKYHQGTYFAIDKVRKTFPCFKNFDIQLFDNITCGTNIFDYNYSKECYLKIKDELGIVHIPSYYDSTALTIGLFNDLGINMPIIAGMGEVLRSINRTSNPNFFRLVRPHEFCTTHYQNVLRKNNWTKLIVFYTDDSWGEDYYKINLELEKKGDITFLNKEKYRKIPSGYRPEMLKDFREHIQDALDTGGNLLFLMMTDPAAFFFLESLAEFGVEYGEFIIVICEPNGQDAGMSNEANFEFRKKLLHGSFFSFGSLWQGDIGKKIKAEFKESGYTSYFPEYYIDTVYAIANTLELILRLGKDYEDTETFINSLLQIKFVGTTGKVSFDLDTNLRSLYFCNQYNIYFDSELGEYALNHVIKIDPISNLYLVSFEGVVWYKSPLQYPNTKSSYYNCPYFMENIVRSRVSSGYDFIINLISLVISSLLTIFLYFKFKFTNIKPLAKVSFIKLIDVIQMLTIIIEPFQMVSISPSFSRISKALSYISSIISLNILKLFSIRGRGYWVLYFSTLGITYSWFILCLLSTQQFYKLFKSKHSKLIEFKNFMTPFIINYSFIPILYYCTSVISCQYTEKRHLNISFLDHDCNFQCWTFTHFGYITLTMTLVTILTPMTIIYRTMWQDSNLNINVKSNGKYLIIKNISSIIVIFHGKAISARSELAYAALFLAMMTFIFSLTFKWVPYNYDRINLWIRVVLGCIIWHSIFVIVDLQIEVNENILASVYLSAWILTVFIGVSLHIKLPPSLLIFKKGRTIIQMLTLGFRLGYLESFNTSISRRLSSLRRGRRFK